MDTSTTQIKPPNPIKLDKKYLDKANQELMAAGLGDILADITSPEYVESLKPPSNLVKALEQVITTDKDIIASKEQAKKLAPTSIPVLITGETGTGKELFARILHGNRTGKFIAINCGGIPETLIEGEFFGSMPGAFTGATNRAGYFEQAKDGTLFLDEIAELERPLQCKLLRVLQEKCVRRIGGKEEIPINCRIVSATNHPVEDLKADNKRFRLDLFYRLAGSMIYLKPLRDRGDDIQLIVDNLIGAVGFDLRKLEKDGKTRYWEGNIRELANAVEEYKALSSI